jgi:hypothetical protein
MSDKPMVSPERVVMGVRALGLFLALGLFVLPRVCVARTALFARNSSESDDDFMARVLGGSAELAQKVVRSTELANGKVTLIGFTAAEDGALVGHLLVETPTGPYVHVQFPSCEVDGGWPNLLAVFFARTGKEVNRDLAVLCRWDVNGVEGDADGAFYGAEFYRLKAHGSDMVVDPIKELNAKFKTANLVVDKPGRTVWIERAKFKTVAEVKRLLAKMGLRQ